MGQESGSRAAGVHAGLDVATPQSRPQGAHPPVALSRPRATETPARPRQARKAVRSSSLDQQCMLVTSLQLRAVLARIGGPGKETPLELGKRRPSLGTRCGNPVINYSETVGRQLRIRIQCELHFFFFFLDHVLQAHGKKRPPY